MAARHDDRHGDDNGESYIREIKQRLTEMSGGRIVALGTDALPPDECEKFWHRGMAFENDSYTTNFERLIEAGVELPKPDSMNDDS